MKKFLMAVIALIMTVGAASAQKCMYVWMKDGTHLSIPVSSFDSVGFYAPTYTLSVTTEGEGSVTGAGAYKIDTEVSLTATAASGYTFSQWSDGKTDNPRIIKMERDISLTAVFTAVGGGATGGIGLFSVSATQQVTFSPGNLQYQASTNTWRFAEHQWDMVGMGYGQTNTDNWCYIGGTLANSNNWQIGSSYSGWIDLFGWGTGNAPTKNSTDYSDYQTFVDWGTNAISNGGNQANMWRTLTKDEWDYLFSGRANASSKYGVGMVNGINGMIVLPDEFTLPVGLFFTSGVHDSFGWQYYKEVNNYSAAEWARMEACGALFLPAAGGRGSRVAYVGTFGYYWSSTPEDTRSAYYRNFGSDETYWNDYGQNRFLGFCVRLARAAQGEQEPVYSLSVSVEGEGMVTGEGEYKNGTTATLTATPAEGYTFTRWSDGNTDNPRTITMTQNLTLTAVFAKNTFLVSFVNYDGTELQSSEVEAGTMPQYNGTEPTKPADAQYTYTFAGWDKEIATVTANATYTATFEAIAVGGGSTGGIGLFSVSATQQVTFSPGNLQYQASTDTWRFAEHQWDMVGMGYGQTNTDNDCYIGGTVANSDNRNISSNYSGWIDLFGWGTGNAPTKSSTSNSDYPTFVDWGTNPISNGGNQANMWRTLTDDEWYYLFKTRANASSKYGVGMVNGINGMIVLPDEFTLPVGLTFTSGVHYSHGWQYYMKQNNYSAAEWARMEACGALFLPAAGYRSGSNVKYVGNNGHYWSSTPYSAISAYRRYFGSYYSYFDFYYRYYGHSVRLAR